MFAADAAVNRLQTQGGRAVRAIEAAFPGTTAQGAVDRPALRRAVLGKPEALARLEALTPEGYQARIDLSITDDWPLAQAFVIISAVPPGKS